MQSQYQVTTQVLNTNPLFDSTLPTIAKALYMALEKLTDARGVLQCSHEYLAKVLSTSRRSVIRHIALLEAGNYIRVERSAVNSKIPNVYKINNQGGAVSESHGGDSSDVPDNHQSKSQVPESDSSESGKVSQSHDNVSSSHRKFGQKSAFEGENSVTRSESHTKNVCLFSTDSNYTRDSLKDKQTTLYDRESLQDRDGNLVLENDPYTPDELPELKGMARHTVMRLVEEHGFSVVSAVIKHAKTQHNLTNPPGFVIRVLQGRIPLDLTSEIRDIYCARTPGVSRFSLSKYAAFMDC